MEDYEIRVRTSFARQAYMKMIGAELTEVRPGSTEIRFPYASPLTQQDGFLHAAVTTAALDSACGYAALSVGPQGREVLSIEFKVNMLSPAVGESFVARAQVKRAGKKTAVCTADAFAVRDGREKLIATMLATMMFVPAPKGESKPGAS